jgi:23S rRNA (cytidine1920-2'-O)/16S rRNA (cytidine1409-2'-O)-methyltransferase
MDLSALAPPFDLVVVDCSFISLELLFPNLVACMGEGSNLIALVKPQFEAKEGELEAGAVVTKIKTREAILNRIQDAARSQGLRSMGVVDSKLPGAKAGNVECLLHCYFDGQST